MIDDSGNGRAVFTEVAGYDIVNSVDDSNAKPDRRLNWSGQAITALLGAAAGMATNQFTGAAAVRAVVASLVTAALIGLGRWLVRPPQMSTLKRFAAVVMLVLSLAAEVSAIFAGGEFARWATFGAVAFAITATLIYADRAVRFRMLQGIAAIGLGVAIGGLGTSFLVDGYGIRGSALWLGCIATIGASFAFLNGNVALDGISKIVAGIACVGISVDDLAGDIVLRGMAVLGFGLTFLFLGSATLFGREILGALSLAGSFLATIGIGFGFVFGGNVLIGAALISVGVAASILFVSALFGTGTSFWMAVVGLGLAFISVGVAGLAYGNVLYGVANTVGGVAISGGGTVALMRGTFGQWIREKFRHVTKAPNSELKVRPRLEAQTSDGGSPGLSDNSSGQTDNPGASESTLNRWRTSKEFNRGSKGGSDRQ